MIYLSALAVGLVLGLLGGGGGIITVPTLMYAAKLSPKESVANTLVILTLITLFSAVREIRAKRVYWEGTIIFAGLSIFGSFLGARLSVNFISERALLLIFVTTVFCSALLMMVKAFGALPKPEDAPPKNTPFQLFLLWSAGLVAGLLGGMVGVGGGFLMVPALNLISGFPMTIAVGTNLVIISVKSFVGVLGYVGEYRFRWDVISLFFATGIIGSIFGVKLRSMISEKVLRLSFALFLFFMSGLITYDRILS